MITPSQEKKAGWDQSSPARVRPSHSGGVSKSTGAKTCPSRTGRSSSAILSSFQAWLAGWSTSKSRSQPMRSARRQAQESSPALPQRGLGESGFAGGLDLSPPRPGQLEGERVVEHPRGLVAGAVGATGDRDASRGGARLRWVHVSLGCHRDDTGGSLGVLRDRRFGFESESSLGEEPADELGPVLDDLEPVPDDGAQWPPSGVARPVLPTRGTNRLIHSA